MMRIMARSWVRACGVADVGAQCAVLAVVGATRASSTAVPAHHHGVCDAMRMPNGLQLMLLPPCTAKGAIRMASTSVSEATSSDKRSTVPWGLDVCRRIASAFEKEYGSGRKGLQELLRTDPSAVERVLKQHLVRRTGALVYPQFVIAAERYTNGVIMDVLNDQKFKKSVHARSDKMGTFVDQLQNAIDDEDVASVMYGTTPVLLLSDPSKDSQSHSQLKTRKVEPVRANIDPPAGKRLHKHRPSFERMPVSSIAVIKPMVVAGSSGSGKTDFMVAGGSSVPAAVLYTRAAEFEQILRKARDKNHRDRLFLKRFGEMLDAATRRLFRQNTASAAFGIDQASAIRVVVDEAGSGSQPARALLSMHERVRKIVATKLSVSTRTIKIFVGGTGSASPDESWGTEPSSYEVVNMDTFGWRFARHFHRALPVGVRDHLDRASAAPSSAAAWEYRAMLSNPRLGAMLVNHTRALATYYQRACLAHFPDHAIESDEQLKLPQATIGVSVSAQATLSALDAMTGFFLLNGLESLLRPSVKQTKKPRTAPGRAKATSGGEASLVTVLAQALAIDVGCYDCIADKKMQEKLLTKYGVLQDRAEEVETVEPGFREVPRMRHVAKRNDTADQKKVLVVPVDCKGRFEMPAAYRAMLLRLWFGNAVVDLHDVGAVPEWELLERHVWRWAAVLTACVTPERSLEDLVVLSSVGRLYPAKDASSPLIGGGDDPLHNYRNAWFTGLKSEPFAATIGRYTAGAKRMQTSPIRDLCPTGHGTLKLASVKDGVALVELHRQMPFATKQIVKSPQDLFLPSLSEVTGSRGPSRALGIAMLNAPKAPFADVVAHVFDRRDSNPAETLFVQVKRHGTTERSLDNEVAKLGAGATPMDGNRFFVAQRVKALCKRHGLFVAVIASKQWKALGPGPALNAQKLLRTSDADDDRALVLHLEVTEDGTWATKPTGAQTDWMRPVLFPLILDDQLQAQGRSSGKTISNRPRATKSAAGAANTTRRGGAATRAKRRPQ